MSERRKQWIQAAVLVAVAAASGCPAEYPQKPQLRVQLSPNPFDFDPIYVGTSRQGSIGLTNKGLDDLVIASIRLTGDPSFSVYSAGPNPTLTTVQANKTSFYSIIFAPTAAGSFTGNVNIASNAENAPSQDIPVLGTGVAP